MSSSVPAQKRMGFTHFCDAVQSRWPQVTVECKTDKTGWELACSAADLVSLSRWLSGDLGMSFGTLIVEETPTLWIARYVFYDGDSGKVVEVTVHQPLEQCTLPSIATQIHAADWHEREAEDLFGLVFTGHPRLGDFILHEHWPEGVNPMRRSFSASQAAPRQEGAADWQPLRLLDAEGAFVMPVGPIYSDYAESALFLLETVGEDVLRAVPRLFFKYRGIEKIAEGRSASDVVLLAERSSGISAFAHSLAFCCALETIEAIEIPPRAGALRLIGAELERIRHHVAVLAKLCGSTALAVATSQAALLEEELLRISCRFSGHRYLFGLNVPGGLSLNVPDDTCAEMVQGLDGVWTRLQRLRHKLTRTNSFLDRLEEVGVIRHKDALDHGLVGPVARASGVALDLRRSLPYGPYASAPPVTVPGELEGDGYARMRVFFAEIEASLVLIKQTVEALPEGPVAAEYHASVSGTALSWVEAPGGAAFHWVRTDDHGHVVRWRLGTPSFANWHGFHLAAEKFAFQDFPIIMASMGLSIAESDR